MDRKRIAVVSGGSSGIGRAFVRQLHGLGYQVVFCGRNETRLREVERECPGTRGYRCDVESKESVLELAGTVLSDFPNIDLLVSNAGGLREIDLTRADPRTTDLGEEIRTNLLGAIHLVSAFMPGVLGTPGSAILVISSGYALAPATRAPLYSAAKAGLRAFTKALRRQLTGRGVLVAEVAPPVVDTPSVAHRHVAKMPAERVVAEALSAISKGRTEIYPGPAKLLPLLLRLAPGLTERMIAKS